MAKTSVSVVSYLNSKPFSYGLLNSAIQKELNVSFDVPATCAEKVISGKADIGLVPVAVIPVIPAAEIISDYCIAADGRVDSVLLISDVPLNEIKQIYLDAQSRTSVLLAKILASSLWKISPQWINESGINNIYNCEAAVLIGDRALEMNNSKKYTYDLAEEWKKLTGLPFVFACWVANKKLPGAFINSFNEALEFGVDNINEMSDKENLDNDKRNYLQNIIQYKLDERKRKAIELFLQMSKDFNKLSA